MVSQEVSESVGLAVDHDWLKQVIEYYARKFKPRESVIRELKADSKKKAIKEAEDLFKQEVDPGEGGIVEEWVPQ